MALDRQQEGTRECVAPTVLDLDLMAYPALTGWANLWRACGAGTVAESDPRMKRSKLVPLDRRSPPFAKGAKDGALSRSFERVSQEGNPRAQSGMTVRQSRALQRPTQEPT